MKIRMLRNVLVEGKHCAAGEVVEVEERLATALIQWGRAEVMTNDELRITNGEKGGRGEGEIEIETATRAGGKRRGQ